MIRVLHLVDETTSEAQLQSLRTLLARLPEQDFDGVVGTVAPRTRRPLEARLNRKVVAIRSRPLPQVLSVPRLRACCREHGADLVHAWGVQAAQAAAAGGFRMGVSLDDPATIAGAARWLRQIEPAPAVVVSGQVLRARLLTAGIAPARVVVIRPPVEFGAINEARRRDVRQALGGPGGTLLLVPGPASRTGGQFSAVWAAAILYFLRPGVRIVLPFDSNETRRLRRFVDATSLEGFLMTPGDRFAWPELVAAADAMLVCPGDEAATEPIAWAMAAGVPVVGVARRSVAELIADRHNGLLCRDGAPRRLAAALIRLLDDDSLRRRITEEARGQAFEVFSVRTFVDNHIHLYLNLSGGTDPGHGIRDTAMVA